MKVIIFTETKVGEGHYQAARAIEIAFRRKYGHRVETKIISGLNCIHPLIEWFIVWSYFFMLKYCSTIWKNIYTRTRKSSFIQTYVFAQRLESILKKEVPDVILCTHTTCIPALGQLKRKGKYTFKLGAVFTDYHFHPYFANQNVDYYFVANQYIKDQLNQKHEIDLNKIYDFGIPLHPKFDTDGHSMTNVLRFKHHNVYHILILGGATGHGPIEQIILAFENNYASLFRLTVITGNNNKLYERLKQKECHRVQVLGYVTNMQDWLKYVDFVISKPGGLTVSESIACGTPIIMIKPIPGHEEANRNYMERQGLGLYVENVAELPYKIKKVIDHPEQLNAWKERITNQQKKQSALNIVETMMESLIVVR
jgi:processive 1,2-diacylglycerol beta-glucosyltransferase